MPENLCPSCGASHEIVAECLMDGGQNQVLAAHILANCRACYDALSLTKPKAPMFMSHLERVEAGLWFPPHLRRLRESVATVQGMIRMATSCSPIGSFPGVIKYANLLEGAVEELLAQWRQDYLKTHDQGAKL